MGIVYALLPLSLILAFAGVAAYLWALRSGQYKDLDAEAHRLLIDEEEK